MDEIRRVVPELTADTVASIRADQEKKRMQLQQYQESVLRAEEKNYSQAMDRLAEEIDAGLDRILPDDILNELVFCVDRYSASYGKANSTQFVENSLLFLGFLDFPVKEFVSSSILASFVNEKYQKLTIDGVIRFPLICSSQAHLPLYIQKVGTDSAKENAPTRRIFLCTT